MKLFITIISLIICQQFQAQATEFTEERANKLGRDFRSHYVISQYNKGTGLNFDDLDSTEKEYRLTSGVDVRVSKAALSQISTYSMPKKLKGFF